MSVTVILEPLDKSPLSTYHTKMLLKVQFIYKTIGSVSKAHSDDSWISSNGFSTNQFLLADEKGKALEGISLQDLSTAVWKFASRNFTYILE